MGKSVRDLFTPGTSVKFSQNKKGKVSSRLSSGNSSKSTSRQYKVGTKVLFVH